MSSPHPNTRPSCGVEWDHPNLLAEHQLENMKTGIEKGEIVEVTEDHRQSESPVGDSNDGKEQNERCDFEGYTRPDIQSGHVRKGERKPPLGKSLGRPIQRPNFPDTTPPPRHYVHEQQTPKGTGAFMDDRSAKEYLGGEWGTTQYQIGDLKQGFRGSAASSTTGFMKRKPVPRSPQGISSVVPEMIVAPNRTQELETAIKTCLMGKAERDLDDAGAEYQRLMDSGLTISASMVAKAADENHRKAMREIWGE